MKANQTSKTILVTGSTDGIGKLTALKLAKDGHQIIVHGRNPKKVENTVSEIVQTTSNENISGVVADLSDFESIKKMISELNSSVSKLDVLINNAGVFKSKIQSNENGLDVRFVVNYLAPYLIMNGLLPTLKNADSARVINLSSAAQASISVKALTGSERLNESEAYAQSKLALTMLSFYFSKQNPKVNTIAVNPGSLLNTNMVKEAYGHHWASADKGVSILYELAVSEKHTANSGKYFDNDRGVFSNAHPDAYDAALIERLISETESIVND